MTYTFTLRQARKYAGLSYDELCERIGVSRSMVTYYENGKGRPPFEMVFAWAKACGISIDDIRVESGKEK